MTIGLPKIFSKIYSKINPPNSIERKMFKAYARYLRFYVKAWTWCNYDRKNSAPLYPLKILWISPEQIELGVRKSKLSSTNGTLLPRILDGDWDRLTLKKIEERKRYQSMKHRFKQDVRWEDTKFYQKKLNQLNQNNTTQYGGAVNSKKELDAIFENIDGLYKEIKENGYKTQKEIKKKEKIVNAKLRPDHYTNELNEIIVDIGRSGEIFFHENRHRFYIAKILGLEKIPVRVLVRHKKWQEKRNLAIDNPEKLDDATKKHPDIEYLL